MALPPRARPVCAAHAVLLKHNADADGSPGTAFRLRALRERTPNTRISVRFTTVRSDWAALDSVDRRWGHPRTACRDPCVRLALGRRRVPAAPGADCRAHIGWR